MKKPIPLFITVPDAIAAALASLTPGGHDPWHEIHRDPVSGQDWFLSEYEAKPGAPPRSLRCGQPGLAETCEFIMDTPEPRAAAAAGWYLAHEHPDQSENLYPLVECMERFVQMQPPAQALEAAALALAWAGADSLDEANGGESAAVEGAPPRTRTRSISAHARVIIQSVERKLGRPIARQLDAFADASPAARRPHEPRARALDRNVEIKAYVDDLEALERAIKAMATHGPERFAHDETFFACLRGRLKLRELAPTGGS